MNFFLINLICGCLASGIEDNSTLCSMMSVKLRPFQKEQQMAHAVLRSKGDVRDFYRVESSKI